MLQPKKSDQNLTVFKVLAILKPNKSTNKQKSYRWISLLCIPFKHFKRLIYNRIQHIVKKNFPHKLAGFRHGRGNVDQVTLMTNNIKHFFDKKKKVGAVFVDISSAYDTVWHRRLTFKLLKTIPNKNIVKMIVEMISQRYFVLHLAN